MFWTVVVVTGIGGLILLAISSSRDAEEKQVREARDPKLFCPHCQQFGHVATEPTTVRRGISGGKACAALFTGGLSMLATGLSQKEAMTKATCSNCGATWQF